MNINILQIFSFLTQDWYVKFNIRDLKKNFYLSCLVQYNKFYIFLSFIRFSSLFFNNTMIEMVSFENNKVIDLNYNSVNNLTVVYNFYFFLLNLQFNLAVLKNFNKSIPSIASLYKIAQWSEREVGEMHGVVFKRKLDNRRLLLDYSFVGYPLLKSFAIMGYVELCFNFTLSWLYYLSLKLRDGGEHIIYFA